METLEELMRKDDPRGQLVRQTRNHMAIALALLANKTYEDASGRATSALYEDFDKHNPVHMGMSSLNTILNKMAKIGLIDKEVRGKRTFKIEAVYVPPEIYDYLPDSLKNTPAFGYEPTVETGNIVMEPTVVYTEAMQDYTQTQITEAEELGMRPGRLAARIEKSIPDLVTRAVDDAFENKLVQLFAGLGFIKGNEVFDEEKLALQDTASRLIEVNNQLVEESRKIQTQLDHARRELNEARERTAGNIIAGSLQPSQLKKELQDLAKWALDSGWTIRRTNGGHLAWNYGSANPVIFTASTPSDSHVVANIKGDLMRVMRAVGESIRGNGG